MAMSVDQTGHQQLCAVTDDVGARIFGCDFGETAGLLDDAVDDYNCPGRDHARCSEARIGDRICAAHDDGVGHDLAPLQISAPTGASPATVIADLSASLASQWHAALAASASCAPRPGRSTTGIEGPLITASAVWVSPSRPGGRGKRRDTLGLLGSRQS